MNQFKQYMHVMLQINDLMVGHSGLLQLWLAENFSELGSQSANIELKYLFILSIELRI